jgi:hypothetical protein
VFICATNKYFLSGRKEVGAHLLVQKQFNFLLTVKQARDEIDQFQKSNEKN